MPDAYGFPDNGECIQKLKTIVPDTLSTNLEQEMANILSSVIVEFQAMPLPDGTGGTGRQFQVDLSASSRFFDGNDRNRILIDDFQSGSVTSVKMDGGALTDWKEMKARDGSYHQLLRYTGFTMHEQFARYLRFRVGPQNIEVNAIWGIGVSQTVWEALRCEVCYRAQVLLTGMQGTGYSIKASDYELNTAAGVSVWAQSSSMPLLHQQYLTEVKKWRQIRIA